jgi:hypothetical protein
MLPHAFPGRNRLVDLGRSRLGRYASSVVQPVRVDEGGAASAWHPAGRRTVDEQLSRFASADEAEDFAALMMRLDLQTYLPGDILTKVDRTSMAVSLEARVPLLDFDLVDFALRIPGDLRVTTAESKRLFRRAIRGIAPDFVLSGPKRGFAMPLAQWFRGSLRHRIEALRNPPAAIEQFLNVQDRAPRSQRPSLAPDRSELLARCVCRRPARPSAPRPVIRQHGDPRALRACGGRGKRRASCRVAPVPAFADCGTELAGRAAPR